MEHGAWSLVYSNYSPVWQLLLLFYQIAFTGDQVAVIAIGAILLIKYEDIF